VDLKEESQPDLSQSGGGRDQLEVLADEFLSRRRQGERPTIEEYADRRPDLAEAIRDLFPTLLLVEDLGGGASGAPAGAPAANPPGIAEGAPAAAPSPDPGGLRQVGEYRILREIGRGGMGIVYEAVQESLGRRVALKVLPFHSTLGLKHLERFQQEARAAARLSHPNIVPVYGVGEHLGLHYFAMQYIPGQGLDRVIEEVRRLREGGSSASDSGIATGDHGSRSGRERYHRNAARIARDAALALDHAHREGVLHRDVKPSNLLLDPTGHVWLADFGLAKSTGSDHLTGSGDFLGTFRYMAPERFQGWSDPRSDVYALGLTLYELLALRPAFAERNRERLLRKLASEDPPPLRQIDPTISHDLETIVMKASAREPTQRYASAREAAEDLDRYLRGEPVAARRSTLLGRLKRWCVRNPALAGLLAAVLILLMVIATISPIAAVQLARARAAGQEKLREAYLAEARALRSSGRPGQRFGALAALAEASKIRPGADLRDEAAACVAVDDTRAVKSWADDRYASVWFDADLRRVALAGRGGEVVVRATEDDRGIVKFPGPGFDIGYVAGCFHPGGRYLCVRYQDAGHRLDRWNVWDLERREATAEVEDGESTNGIDFDPRDGSIVVPARGGLLRTLEPSSGRTLSEHRFPFRIGWPAVHPGGELVALTQASGKEVRLVERSSGLEIHAFRHPEQPSHAAWHPRGRFLAVSCLDFRVYLWDALSGALRWSVPAHEAEAVQVCFPPGGEVLLSAGWEDKLHFWDAWTGRSLFVLPGKWGTFSADGRSLAILWKSGYEKRELSPPRDCFTLYGHEQRLAKQPRGVVLAPGGRLAATWGDDGVRLWDLTEREAIGHLPVELTTCARFDQAGAYLLTGGQGGLHRWPIRSRAGPGGKRMIFGPPEVMNSMRVRAAACGDSGRRVAALCSKGHVHVLPGEGADQGRSFDAPGLEYVAFSADGRWIAGSSKSLDRSLLYRAADGKLERELDAPFGLVQFDPRDRYLVVGTPTAYHFLGTEDWKPLRQIPRSARLPFPAPIAFDPGGSVMAIAQSDSRIWLLEVGSGDRLLELEANDPHTLNGLALDLGGGILAASSPTQRFHVWDLRGVKRQLAALGLSLTRTLPAQEPAPPQSLHVDVLTGGSTLGSLEDPEDPHAAPLFRRYRHALFRPRLESYGELDLALSAPGFLVPEGAVWRFHRGRAEPSPGLDWTSLGFDDSRWESGESGFGARAQDPETGTVLLDQIDSYTTIYLRHVFEVEEGAKFEKLLLSLSFEDGFVAYLNGKEVARSLAGAPGERLSFEAVASRVRDRGRPEFLSSLDRSLLLPGKNVIAVQGLTLDSESYLFLLPVLAAALPPEEARDRARTEHLARGAASPRDPALAAYRQGRILERAGKIEDALTAFRRAALLDPGSPEPILRQLECHGIRGEHDQVRSIAHDSIVRGQLLDDEGVWTAWVLSTFRDPNGPLSDSLSAWPEAARAAAGTRGPVFRSIIEELSRSRAVRINCGGAGFTSKSGKVWWSDRFFLSGAPLPEDFSPSLAIEGTGDGALYRTQRWFPGERPLRPGYRLPLPPGRYRVSLHFAEVVSNDHGRRSFSVYLQRKPVLEAYEPLNVGFATADVKTFEAQVAGGYLDLDFFVENNEPVIAAIEIERRD
jgi:serine/threonine protein kinase/WD40 repeat protein